MAGVRHALEQLRDMAIAEPSDFARLLRKLLVFDFDATLSYIKTQKLVSKRKSSAWISRLELEMRDWLAHAPLKGKQKSQVRRHLAVCSAIQELLEIVDKRSSSLRIWQASTRDLLHSLFASVEELCFLQEARELERKFQPEDALAGLKGTELLRKELRIHCDYVTRIVNQIPRVGIKEAGLVSLSGPDIRDAVQVAALDDLILHVLDCYSYKNFRVSVEQKHLTMFGVTSQLEQALTWSSLRARTREIVDGHGLSQQIKKLDALAGTLACESQSFSHFLDSSAGGQLLEASQVVRKEYARILRRDVVDQIDLDLPVRTQAGTFRAQDLLDCWASLFQLATCAQIWCRASRNDTVAVLPVAHLVSLFESSLGCTTERGESFVSQFSLDPSEPNQDPFFRPLIKLNAEERLIAAAFIATGRFSRNLFTIAIREGKVNFTAKGLKPLKVLYEEFLRAGYQAVINFPIMTSQRMVTDVDIAATKDGFLFVGQTKVVIHPDTIYDDWKVLENLRKAARQLRLSLQHISSLQERLGLKDGEFLVVPFLLTNVWGFTGATVDGFKVVDFSYLSLLLRGGELWKVHFEPVPMREIRKLIRGAKPTGEELSKLLRNPIHEAMFERPKLETYSFVVGDWTVSVPIDIGAKPSDAAGGEPDGYWDV